MIDMKLALFMLVAAIIWNLDRLIDALNRPKMQRIEAQERVELIKLVNKSRDFPE